MIAGLRRGLRRHQLFDPAVPHQQPRDVRARQIDKLGAEVNVVAEIVHSDLQIFERKGGRKTAQPRRRCRIGFLPEFEKRKTRH